MSKLTVKPNDSGIGEVKITGPNTNSTRYQVIPDVSGNVVVSDGSLLTVDHNTSQVNFGGATELGGAVVKGLFKWEIVNSNTTLSVNRNYFANTRGQANLTLTLPASANIGDTIQVIDNEGYSSSNNIFIANGTSTQTIDGGVRKLTLTTDRESVKLFYTGTGWVSKQQESTTREGNGFGDIFGYQAGGFSPTVPGNVATVDKFPFSNDTNAANVTDLSLAIGVAFGHNNKENGYISGGVVNGGAPPANPTGLATESTIQKFPFASDTNITDTSGDLLDSGFGQGASASSKTHGYSSGGYTEVPNDTIRTNIIQKFPFAISSGTSTDVGDLQRQKNQMGGQMSVTHGYATGGSTGLSEVTDIDKFPFASDTNASAVGSLLADKGTNSGQSSSTHGYASGDNPANNVIEKFPFASDENSTDVGDLTSNREQTGGNSSSGFGYAVGGNTPPNSDVIDKFPFASDTNATDIGNLTQARQQLQPTGPNV